MAVPAAMALLALAGGFAQQGAPPGERPSIRAGAPQPGLREEADEPVLLEDLVVTAVANPLSQRRSSVSATVLYPTQLQQSVPSNAADVLRNVPGILAQASGGEGNANISARGLPQSGGAKLTQFQEDGLPVLDFGDIAFSTADTFLRADYTVERLEVVRGGSAATFASNAPGGVFNFISRTGEIEEASIGVTQGLDFDQTRIDFNHGRPVGPPWRFHVGGFYRVGEGPRTVGYRAEEGGQFKGNITRVFESGYIRLFVKLLEDHAPVYLPVPVSITGSNSDPHVASLPGFDFLHGAMQSLHFRRDISVNRDGVPVVTDVADGYDSRSRAIGGEVSLDLPGGWKLHDKFRLAATAGDFVGPYPAEVAPVSDLAASIGGVGAMLRYATGPRSGQPIDDPGRLNGNGLAIRTHLFNTTLHDMGNAANELKLTKVLEDVLRGTATVTLGYFKSRQELDQDWHWNTYLQEVRGEDSALLDVVDANGNLVTQNGLVAYGPPAWGLSLVRSEQVTYDTDAPYLALAWEQGAWNLDASLRYDIARAAGTYASATGTTVLDVDGDGMIAVPEQAVPIVDRGAALPVDYTNRYLSYSIGANYLLRPELALFARVGEGGRANADRLLFGGGILPDGDVVERVAVNKVRQVEGGVKWHGHRLRALATLFYATTKVTDQDITSVTARFTDREFVARGLELQADYLLGRFSASGGLTYTRAEISKDEITPQNVGLQINARLIYQLTLAFNGERLGGGVNVIGTTDAPLERGLVTPAFTQVNAYASYAVDERMTVSLVGNNIFNTIGVTEIPGGTAGVTPSGVNTARSITGRTVAVVLKWSL